MSKLQDDIRALLDLNAPAPGSEPVRPERAPRPKAHARGCWCAECWERGMDYAHYLKQKRMNEL